MDARDRREANPPQVERVKEKPDFTQWEFVNRACEIIAATGEYHIDYGPLMFHFYESKKLGEDFCTVMVSSKQFKTAPFKLKNIEGDDEFIYYAEAFFAVQDFVESLQFEKETKLPEMEW